MSRSGRNRCWLAQSVLLAVVAMGVGCSSGGDACEKVRIQTPDLTLERHAGGVSGVLVITVLRPDGTPAHGVPMQLAIGGENAINYTISNIATTAQGRVTVDMGQAYKIDYEVRREVSKYSSYSIRVTPLGPINGVSYCLRSAKGRIVHSGGPHLPDPSPEIDLLDVTKDVSCRPFLTSMCFDLSDALSTTFDDTAGLQQVGPAVVTLERSGRAVGRAQLSAGAAGQQAAAKRVRQRLERTGWRFRGTENGATTFDGAKAFPGASAIVRPGRNGTVQLVVTGPRP